MARLFDPYTLKSTTLRNRIAVSPMCQYMARDGAINAWHQAHYASLARGGAGLVVVEATAVAPEGRITWGDLGLWNDAQADALRKEIVATKEGGAITGEERLREHTDQLYGAINSWEGQPSAYQLTRITVLQGQLTDISGRFDALAKGELAGVNAALSAHKLTPIALPPPAAAGGTEVAGGDQLKSLNGWRFGLHSSAVRAAAAAEKD